MFIIQNLMKKNTRSDINALMKVWQENCSFLKSKREKNTKGLLKLNNRTISILY